MNVNVNRIQTLTDLDNLSGVVVPAGLVTVIPTALASLSGLRNSKDSLKLKNLIGIGYWGIKKDSYSNQRSLPSKINISL